MLQVNGSAFFFWFTWPVCAIAEALQLYYRITAETAKKQRIEQHGAANQSNIMADNKTDPEHDVENTDPHHREHALDGL